MKHPYLPHTEADIQSMLSVLGIKNISELFDDIHTDMQLKSDLNLPDSISEVEVLERIKEQLSLNTLNEKTINFAGGGIYEHTLFAAVSHLISRSEFYTAYTPYQPEISQGTLQGIFEYQTMICEMTGMEASNASHYDGATATAEGVMMALNTSKQDKVLVSEGVHPDTMAVIKTYVTFKGAKLETIPLNDGVTDLKVLENKLDGSIAAFVVESPNFLGQIENVEDISHMVHGHKGLLIQKTNLLSTAILKEPGQMHVDICTGDAQSFGNPMNFGGPTIGFMATTKKLMRKLPGRIVGQTKDLEGKTAYVLTLQAREQHIRRQKATSNITSNQALNALATTITLTLLGPSGTREMALKTMANTHYFAEELSKIKGVEKLYCHNAFADYVLRIPNASRIHSALIEHNVVMGILLERYNDAYKDHLLVSVTEKYHKDQIDYVVEAVKTLLAKEDSTYE